MAAYMIAYMVNSNAEVPKTTDEPKRNAAGGKAEIYQRFFISLPAYIPAASENIGSIKKNSAMHTIIPISGDIPIIMAGRSSITARLAASAAAALMISYL